MHHNETNCQRIESLTPAADLQTPESPDDDSRGANLTTQDYTSESVNVDDTSDLSRKVWITSTSYDKPDSNEGHLPPDVLSRVCGYDSRSRITPVAKVKDNVHVASNTCN